MENNSMVMRPTLYLTLSLIGLAGVGFFILNLNIPLFADDYCRMLQSANLKDIFEELSKSYAGWSGRIPTIFLTYLTLSTGSLGLLVFQVANSLVLCVVCFLVLDRGIREYSLASIFRLSLFLCLLWFGLNVLGEVMLWHTGAIQYFWGVALSFYILTLLNRFLLHDSFSFRGKWEIFIYYVAVPLGSMWLENLSVAMVAAWIGTLAYAYFIQKKTIPLHLVIGLVMWMAGMIILLAAPGNYVRAASFPPSIVEMSVWTKIPTFVNIMFDTLDIGVVIACLCILTIATVRECVSKLKFKSFMLYAGFAVLTFYAMLPVPGIFLIGRATYPFEFFMIIAVISLIPDDLFAIKKRQQATAYKLLGCASALLLAPVLVHWYLIYSEYQDIYQQVEERLEIVAKARSSAASLVEFHPLVFNSEFNTWMNSTAITPEPNTVNAGPRFASDIRRRETHWANNCYETANNIPAVRLINP